MSKKTKISLLALAVAALLAGVLGLGGVRAGEMALAEYSVGNLSCGSCVNNIQEALSGVEGVGRVEVSVTTGRVKGEFEPERIDAARIATLIEQAGYPAKLDRVLSTEDYRLLREDENALAERFVGRIGEQLVSREDFAEALARREVAGKNPQRGLLQAVWQDLLQRELLLAAADKAGVVVQDGEVELELERLRGREEDFQVLIETRYGDLDSFRRTLREEMIIQRNIEDHVLGGIEKASRRRQVLDTWYRQLVSSVPVTIFDPTLRAAVEGGGSGCGGSCCG